MEQLDANMGTRMLNHMVAHGLGKCAICAQDAEDRLNGHLVLIVRPPQQWSISGPFMWVIPHVSGAMMTAEGKMRAVPFLAVVCSRCGQTITFHHDTILANMAKEETLAKAPNTTKETR